jgi:hypothetical protein
VTDLFRGYDLTTVAETVAEKQYNRLRQKVLSRDPVAADDPDRVPTWESLSPVDKRNYKESLLPVITDVLDALESDQVKPTEAKQMVPYGYNNGDRRDPRWYENQHPLQHDTTTATVWTLHLNVRPEHKDAVLERMSVMPEVTGEFTYDGDSWKEWGEATKNASDQHLAVYFHATPAKAKDIGAHLADHAQFAVARAYGADALGVMNISPTHAVSTSGDYAEQV